MIDLGAAPAWLKLVFSVAGPLTLPALVGLAVRLVLLCHHAITTNGDDMVNCGPLSPDDDRRRDRPTYRRENEKRWSIDDVIDEDANREAADARLYASIPQLAEHAMLSTVEDKGHDGLVGGAAPIPDNIMAAARASLRGYGQAAPGASVVPLDRNGEPCPPHREPVPCESADLDEARDDVRRFEVGCRRIGALALVAAVVLVLGVTLARPGPGLLAGLVVLLGGGGLAIAAALTAWWCPSHRGVYARRLAVERAHRRALAERADAALALYAPLPGETAAEAPESTPGHG